VDYHATVTIVACGLFVPGMIGFPRTNHVALVATLINIDSVVSLDIANSVYSVEYSEVLAWMY